jgi:hypothetical protein
MESRLDQIAAAAKESVQGNYDAAASIFDLTKEGENPAEIAAPTLPLFGHEEALTFPKSFVNA